MSAHKFDTAASTAKKTCQVITMLLLVASPVFGQFSETWDGGGGDDNWTTGGNWADDSAPGDPQGNVNFAGSTRLTPNNNFGSYSAGYRIFFNSGASSFTVNGNPIKFFDFGGNRARIQNDSSSAQTINFRAGAGSAAGGLDFYANSGDITYDGSTTDGGTIFLDGSSQLIVNGSSGRTVTFNKGIVDGNAAGSVAIAGPATAVYNTTGFSYTGDTFVNDGILRLAASGAASATTIRVGDTSGSASPTLQLDNGISAANTIVIRSGSSGTKTVANTSVGSGAATYSGVVYLDDSATLSANAAGTLTLSGGVSFQNSGGGVSRTLTVSGSGNTAISGNLTNAADGNSAVSKTGSGTLTLSGGTNAQQILFNHGGGTIAISSVAHIGVPTGANYPDKFNFTDNATLQVTANSFTLGRNAGGGDNAGFRIAGSKTATFNIASGSTLTIDGVIANISGSGALAKSGTGTLQLNQANTYSGNTTISAGTLALNGSAAISSSPTITLSSGATLELTGLSSAFTLGASQTLAGSGTVNNTAAFTVAGTVAPGASPGTLNSGSETWPGGGDYNWEINDATGTQGTDPGWDLINITGGLDITATSGSKFNINVSTLTTGNVAGDAANFSSSSTYTWTILKTTQGVTNFSASVFNVDTSAFSNSIPANGTFLIELANSGLDIVLRYGLRPAVSAQPTNQTVTTGGSGSFYVTISGTATLTYQWRKSSSNLTDGANISGATTSSLTISPAALTNAGTYDVVVANDFGSITSSTATLTVNCPAITLSPASLASGTVGSAYSDTVSASGGGAPYTFAVTSGSLPPGVALSSGGALSGTPTSAGNYSFTVTATDTYTCTGSSNFSIAVTCPATTATPLTSLTNCPGTSATFSTTAGGAGPFSYVWRFNGNELTGETTNSFMTNNVTSASAGTYTVEVTDTCGSVTNSATLTVISTNGVMVVTISSPSPNFRTNNTLVVTGTAIAGKRIDQVLYKIITDSTDINPAVTNWVETAYALASGTTNWTVAVDLPKPGTNTFFVKCVDACGNESRVVSRKFFLTITNDLTVTITGNGSLNPVNFTNAPLEIGRIFTVTALPGSNYLFTNWTTASSVLTANPKLAFRMITNPILYANFITNRFIGAAGNYYGLFSDTNGVAHESAGFFSVRTDTKLKFSGRLYVNGDTLAFSGTFNQAGVGTLKKLISRKGRSQLDVALNLDLDGGDTVSGIVSNADWFADLLGDRVTFNFSNPASNFAGSYTAILPGSATPGLPAGDGYELITVASNGIVRAKGFVADAVSQSVGVRGNTIAAGISKNGTIPFYAPLYPSSRIYGAVPTLIKTFDGMLLGSVSLTNGTVTWIKRDGWTNGFYPSGFSNDVTLALSPYSRPPTPVLSMSVGSLIYEEGNLLGPLTNGITLVNSTNNPKFVITRPAPTKSLKVTPSTGELKGYFTNPIYPFVVTTIRGAILQNQNVGRGYFAGTNQTGKIRVQTP